MLLSPRFLSLAAWIACGACLATGYALAGWRLMILLIALTVLAGASDRRWPRAAGLSWVALAGTVALSAIGAWQGASVLWMTLAVVLALAGWDLTVFDAEIAPYRADSLGMRAVHRHLKSLSLVLAIGLLAALLGQQISLSIPFLAMLLGVLLLVLSLDHVWRNLNL